MRSEGPLGKRVVVKVFQIDDSMFSGGATECKKRRARSASTMTFVAGTHYPYIRAVCTGRAVYTARIYGPCWYPGITAEQKISNMT